MNLKKEMLQSINNEAEEILTLDESEAEARTLGFVNDNIKANDVLYWVSAIDRDEQEILNYQRQEIDRIKRFTDNKLKSLHKRREFFKTTLESYFSTCKGKSLSLQNGKIGTRKQPDRVVVQDEDALYKWWMEHTIVANNKMMKIVHKPVLKEIKSYIQDIGECPEGVEYKEGKTQFYVRPEEL